MRIRKYRVFAIWGFEKEEKWLNEMAAGGRHLVAVGPFSYEFEEGAPNEYQVRLELLDYWPASGDSRRYISFVESTGAEYLGSVGRWVYFRKRTQDGPFDLFSDIDSRISHLKRIMALSGALGAATFCNGLLQVTSAAERGRSPLAILLAGFLLVGGALLLGTFVSVMRKAGRLRKERALHE